MWKNRINRLNWNTAAAELSLSTAVRSRAKLIIKTDINLKTVTTKTDFKLNFGKSRSNRTDLIF